MSRLTHSYHHVFTHWYQKGLLQYILGLGMSIPVNTYVPDNHRWNGEETMRISRWIEFVCGPLCGILGLLALVVAFFGPGISYQRGTSSGATFSGVSSYAQVNGDVLPYFVLFGLPLVGVALGATLHTQRGSSAGQILLWVSTAILMLLVGLTILSIGLFFLPSLVLALITSGVAIVNRQTMVGR